MQYKFQVQAKDPSRQNCWVGWDPAAESYWFYVAKPMITDKALQPVGENNGHLIEWKGLEPKEIESVERLAELLEPYATLPPNLYQPLRDVRLSRGGAAAGS